MSDTPRTDAKIFETLPGFTSTETVVLADFARQLERELDKIRGDCEAWNMAYHEMKKLADKRIEQTMHDILVTPYVVTNPRNQQ